MFSCLGKIVGRKSDELMWNMKLESHAFGEYSMAVVQANTVIEDQSQVYTSNDSTFVGVYDGHGGQQTAHFVNTHLFTHLRAAITRTGAVSNDVITEAFRQTEEEFMELVQRTAAENASIATVGACCLVGAILENEFFVANLGDSRAVLGHRAAANPRRILAERLTTDHNVGEVLIRNEVQALYPDDQELVSYRDGVYRIKGIIQVSRSIGDAYMKIPALNTRVNLTGPVMTAVPSVIRRQITQQDSFLIFASDGLWEHLTDEAAVAIVSDNPRAGIAKRLLKAAITEAARKSGQSYSALTRIQRGTRRPFHDDISVIVVYLDHIHKQNVSGLGDTAAPQDIYTFNTQRD